VSGSRDGTVKIWDPRMTTNAASIEASTANADCWTVCFGNTVSQHDPVVVAGYDNGDVRLIDLRNMKVRWETNTKKGVCHVSFDRKDILMNKLSVACLNGSLSVYDMRTYNDKSGFAGLETNIGKSTLWGCHSLPEDREIMAVTSGSGEINLFRYSYPPQRSTKCSDGTQVGVAGFLECIGKSDCLTSQPLTSFDWHSGKRGLFATVSFDQVITVGICSNTEYSFCSCVW
jgi:WD40 repeat protein